MQDIHRGLVRFITDCLFGIIVHIIVLLCNVGIFFVVVWTNTAFAVPPADAVEIFLVSQTSSRGNFVLILVYF